MIYPNPVLTEGSTTSISREGKPVYIVMNHLHLDIPIEQVTAKMEKEAIPMISGLPGFIGVYLTENRRTEVL